MSSFITEQNNISYVVNQEAVFWQGMFHVNP